MKQQGSPFGKRELSQPPLDAAPAGLCPAGWGSAGPVLGGKALPQPQGNALPWQRRAGSALLCGSRDTDFMVRCLGACIYTCS